MDTVAEDDFAVVRVEPESGTGEGVVQVIEEAEGLGARGWTRLDGVSALDKDQVVLLDVDEAEREVSVFSTEAQDGRLGVVVSEGVLEFIFLECREGWVLIVGDRNRECLGMGAFRHGNGRWWTGGVSAIGFKEWVAPRVVME